MDTTLMRQAKQATDRQLFIAFELAQRHWRLAFGDGVGLSIHGEGKRTDRASPSRCAQGRARHRLEGTSATVRTVSQTRSTWGEPQQDRSGDCARARRLCVGHCATGQARLIEAARRTRERRQRTSSLTLQLDRRGDALAVGESSDGLLDRQSLRHPRR